MGFLSHEDKRELTGAATKAGQIKMLRENRIPFFVRADGWPVVTWEAVNGSLGSAPPAKSEPFKLRLERVK